MKTMAPGFGSLLLASAILAACGGGSSNTDTASTPTTTKNAHAGYHYQGATDCRAKVASSDRHAGLIGYALDGYGIFALTDGTGAEPTGLDTCRGHTDTTMSNAMVCVRNQPIERAANGTHSHATGVVADETPYA